MTYPITGLISLVRAFFRLRVVPICPGGSDRVPINLSLLWFFHGVLVYRSSLPGSAPSSPAPC